MKTIVFIVFSLLITLLLILILWLIFPIDKSLSLEQKNLFWLNIAISGLSIWFCLLLIQAIPYLVMTPKLGFFVGNLIKLFFFSACGFSIFRLILIFKTGSSVNSNADAIVQIIINFILLIGIMWLLITAAIPSPYGLIKVDAPFHGTYFTMHGGGNIFVNHHHKVPAQAFALDFVKLGPQGFSSSQGNQLTDYYCFDDTLFAPIKGTVIEARGSLPDNELESTNKEEPKGNFIKIKDYSDNIITLAHFKKDSLLVNVGDRITQGTPIGKCGNSGNSSEPHIHIQANKATGESLSLIIADQKVFRGTIIKN